MFKSIIKWLKNNQKNAPIDGRGWRPEGKRPTPEYLAKTKGCDMTNKPTPFYRYGADATPLLECEPDSPREVVAHFKNCANSIALSADNNPITDFIIAVKSKDGVITQWNLSEGLYSGMALAEYIKLQLSAFSD